MTFACLVPLVPAQASPGSRLAPGTLEFLGPGYNNSLVEEAPRESVVKSATLDVTGVMMPGGTIQKTYDWADRGSSKAYHGGDCFEPPFRTPANRRNTEFSNTNYTEVATSDNTRADHNYGLQSSCQCSGTFHHFEYAIDTSVATKIDVHWEGWGAMFFYNFSSGGSATMEWEYSSFLYIYNFTGATWEQIGRKTLNSPGDAVMTISLTANPNDFIGPSKTVSVLAKSNTVSWRIGNETSELHSDFAKIVVTTVITDSWPTNPTLDVGDDGDLDWQYSGEFKTTETVNFTVELQSLIDAAGPGTTPVSIPFNFSTESAGKLQLSNIDIVYSSDAPEWSGNPSGTMQEDGDGTALIDLLDHVSDDGPTTSLTFEILSNDNSDNMEITINTDGHSLDVDPLPDYWGVANIEMRVHDGDDNHADSGTVTITVESVNDAPVLDPIDDRTINEGDTLTMNASASDVDKVLDSSESLSFSDDTDLFDINPYSGFIYYKADDSAVGTHTITITVSDGELEDSRPFVLVIENANDPPTIDTILDQTAYEDQQFTYTVTADDADIQFGDDFTLSDDCTLFDIDPDTGLIDFTPVQDDIGTYNVTITATDLAGASTDTLFVLRVLNTNDNPTIEAIEDIELGRGDVWNYVVEADDEDLDANVGEALTFMVDSEILEINDTTGQISYTPAKEDVGTHKITVTVMDMALESASTTFTLTVTWVNHAPVASIKTADDKDKYKKGAIVQLLAEATDEDNDDLNFTWMEGTDVLGYGSTIDLENLTVGTHNFTLIVSDGDESATASIDIKITKKDPSSSDAFIPGFDTVVVVSTFSLLGVLTFFRRRDGGRTV
jgi:hypothetical protein